jgi:histidine ammonia-lyase
MAAHAARRLGRMCDNLYYILGVEALGAVQGIEFRAPLTTSPALQAALARLRRDAAPLTQDRMLAPEMECAARLIRSGALLEAAGLEGFTA